ncbi:putative transcription factor Spt20 [Helianthus annuus]|nr:putative transcription factor Spt20 [Helianthus annuus]
MVLSFKISRVGTRYTPRPEPEPEPEQEPEPINEEVDEPAQLPKMQSPNARKRSVDHVVDDDCDFAENSDSEVSFILNIFPDGYTIVKPSESNDEEDDLQILRPYDRRSESMITAIEGGYLPVDFLDDDIQCKYINGTVQCELRDYRKESCESADVPCISKLSLKMSLDNVVRDIRVITDSTWSYADLLEAESRILYALQPKLDLDPTPNIDRLCREPTSIKLNLDIRGKRLKRLMQASKPESANASVGGSTRVTRQPDLVNVAGRNVGGSNRVATGPNNHAPQNLNSDVRASRHVTGQSGQNVGQRNVANDAPESSSSRGRDSRHVTGQPEMVNPVNHNVGQSNMVATWPRNDAPESSDMRVRNSRQARGRQPDLVSPVNHNVSQSDMVATWPQNNAPESSNMRVRDSRQVTSQPDFVNPVNHNVGQSNMVATWLRNGATENSNMRVRDSRQATGRQPDLVSPVNHNVSQSNMVATWPQNNAPESSNMRVRDSRQVTSQPDLVNPVNHNVGQSNMVATWLQNNAPENSNMRVSDSRQVTSQPGLVNPVNHNVGQSNMVATWLQNNAPENSNMRVSDSRQVTSQPDLVNLVNHNVGQRNMVGTWPRNDAPENSNMRVSDSGQARGRQSGLVSPVNHNVSQSNMVATWLQNNAPESSNSRVGDSRQVTGRSDLVNPIVYNVGHNNMVATWPKNDAPESSNSRVRDSRQVTGQPDMVNLVNHNVGQSNMVATGRNHHAPENSNARVGDLIWFTSPPNFVNLVDENVSQSNVVAAGPKHHAPENSNMRVGDLRWLTSQPNFVNLVDENVSQTNMIAARPQNHAPNTVISSVSHQSSHQIGVGNLLNMQDHANNINSSSVMSVNDGTGNHCQVLPSANLGMRGMLTRTGLDGNQRMDNIQRAPQQFEPNRSHQRVTQQFTRSMSPNLQSNTASQRGETPFFSFGTNKSTQQAQTAANWRSNSMQQAPVIIGLECPPSVANMAGPSTVSYPDYTNIQDRFFVIKILTERFKLDCKTKKIIQSKPNGFFSTQHLKQHLINDHDDDDTLKDETCKMPLSMSLMGGNMNICKTRVMKFVLNESPTEENGFQETPKCYTRLILSERESDGTVAMHLGDLDDVDYLEEKEEELLPTLPTTHKADLIAEQFCKLMLRDGYQQIGDELEPKSNSTDQSTGGQLNTTHGDFINWVRQILEDDPKIDQVSEPYIGETSRHNMRPRSVGLSPSVSTIRMQPPHMVNNNNESQLQNLFLQQQEQSHNQRKMMMGPDAATGNWIVSNNNNMVGFGMGSDGRTGPRAVTPMMSQNPMATEQGMGPGGLVGQSSNFGGLQGMMNRQFHLGPGSGSGSSSVLILGPGSGINRANDMSHIQRNAMEHSTQNRFINQQQFRLIKQEPTSHLQAVVFPSQNVGSSSSSSFGRQYQQGGPHWPAP